jgi:2-(1,2-epoxy-1,2-dihydrophenyl)acetyl-CoA isomerase
MIDVENSVYDRRGLGMGLSGLSFETVVLEQREHVALITLNRPDVRNAVNEQLLQELLTTLRFIVDSPDIHAVILRGQGDLFCAGGDIDYFKSLLGMDVEQRCSSLRSFITLAHDVIITLNAIRCPVIVTVQGAAAGYGFSLACSADLMIATRGSKFVPAYVALGTSPDGGLSRLLPALIGERRALDVLLTNRIINDKQALQWGLANQVVDKACLDETACRLASELAMGPKIALGNIKRLVREDRVNSLSAHLNKELEAFLTSASQPDFQEGVQAFLEKRAAVFK